MINIICLKGIERTVFELTSISFITIYFVAYL